MQAAFEVARRLGERISRGERAWLFLDYDGTLAGFAPTPDDIIPDPDLVVLLERLTLFPDRLKVIILSGRRLSHVQKLVPLEPVIAAGSYGIEYRDQRGHLVRRVNDAEQRPILERVKGRWQELITGQGGFYLEDKGYSIALHAKDADESAAQVVIVRAKEIAGGEMDPVRFKLLDGNRFIELAPLIAGKGESVTHLLNAHGRQPDEPVVIIGDDDKDEEAFAVVREEGGDAIVVAESERPTNAQYRMANPREVRRWLAFLAEAIETIRQ